MMKMQTCMVKAMHVAEIDSISCFAHTLQLVVTDGILRQPAVKTVLATSRSIFGKFRYSIVAQHQLEELQERYGVACKKLVANVQTRWNSTYNMLLSMTCLSNGPSMGLDEQCS